MESNEIVIDRLRKAIDRSLLAEKMEKRNGGFMMHGLMMQFKQDGMFFYE